MITSGTRRMTLVSQFSIHTPFNAHYSCTRFCVILAILKRRRLLKSTSIFGSLFCQLTRSMQTPFLAHLEQKHSLAYPNHCSFVSHCYSFFFFLLLKRSKGAENGCVYCSILGKRKCFLDNWAKPLSLSTQNSVYICAFHSFTSESKLKFAFVLFPLS